MDHLWSPWRLDYITSADKATGCVSCDARAPDGPQSSLIVHRGASCFVILNLYPYNNGHLMIVPNRHVRSLADMTAEELWELGDLTRRSEIALREAYEPHGMNMG